MLQTYLTRRKKETYKDLSSKDPKRVRPIYRFYERSATHSLRNLPGNKWAEYDDHYCEINAFSDSHICFWRDLFADHCEKQGNEWRRGLGSSICYIINVSKWQNRSDKVDWTVLGGNVGAFPMRKTRGVTALDIIARTRICIRCKWARRFLPRFETPTDCLESPTIGLSNCPSPLPTGPANDP